MFLAVACGGTASPLPRHGRAPSPRTQTGVAVLQCINEPKPRNGAAAAASRFISTVLWQVDCAAARLWSIPASSPARSAARILPWSQSATRRRTVCISPTIRAVIAKRAQLRKMPHCLWANRENSAGRVTSKGFWPDLCASQPGAKRRDVYQRPKSARQLSLKAPNTSSSL